MKKIFKVSLIALIFTSCEFLEPDPIQDLSTDDLWTHGDYGQGLLTYAYQGLAASYPIAQEGLTDNAVPAVSGTNEVALGGWTEQRNPIGSWGAYYNNIKHLNLFLANAEDLIYQVSNPDLDSALVVQRMGEAYFLRAWYEWELLKHYGGPADGEYLGFPVVTEYLEIEDDLNLPRDTYEACVARIAVDLDSAIARLPLIYNGTATNTAISNRGRASGLGAMALKARVYLFAASPAYGTPSQEKWERAAVAARDAIDASGGLTALAPFGNFNDIGNFDHIWVMSGNGPAPADYYPPSLFGQGAVNPSQNLVDAFPAADGLPISQSPNYDPAHPYQNRDPRFERFIFHNGEEYKGTVVQTYQGGNDAPGGLSQNGTRTGYYLQKLMSENWDLTPGVTVTDNSMYVFLRRSELYLNFAEAANEAFGPADASLGYAAGQVLAVIRQRAGIDSDTAAAGYQDQYLDQQTASGQDAFRELLANERRLELCFEGFRFWDMRRTNADLDHTVRGVEITNDGGAYTYNYVNVETHNYADYMRYVPLPFTETLIMTELKQNEGW